MDGVGSIGFTEEIGQRLTRRIGTVKWDLFYRKRRPVRGKERDEFDEFIDVIEAFAPKEHPSEREACYYNYRIMELYRKPLLVLLETISKRDRLEADPTAFARDLFLRLKDFYDPRNRLSLKEAIGDRDLLLKFGDLFLYFYGTKDLPSDPLRACAGGEREDETKGDKQ